MPSFRLQWGAKNRLYFRHMNHLSNYENFMMVRSLISFAGWFLFVALAHAQTPEVTLSFPQDNAICRATVPFFGTATVRGGTDADFKEWRLEYGEGHDPKTWTRITGGAQPVKTDPWAQKTAVWDIHIGTAGNLGDWQTGLVGYQWGEWRNNLNGIYTARLVAELKNGKSAERRLTILIGEAIIRAAGGTAVSQDGNCRYSVPRFAHDGEDALVIAVIRYEPPGGGYGGPFPTAKSGEEAARPYAWLPANLERLSPIYRIYPNGYESDPPSQIQVEIPNISEAMLTTKKSARIYFHSAAQKRWQPLKTAWAGKTASALVSKLPVGEAFFVVLNDTNPPEPPTVAWRSTSALSGSWVGSGEANATLKISDGVKTRKIEIGMDGEIKHPDVLTPSPATYEFTLARSSGEKSSVVKVPVTPNLLDPGKGAVLRVMGAAAQLSVTTPVYVQCESSFGSRFRSDDSVMGLTVQKSTLETLAHVELKKVSHWSNRFVGTLKAGSGPGEIPVVNLKDGETLSLKLANGTSASLKYKDLAPPAVRGLESPTHSAFFWSNPSDPSTPQIRPFNVFSGVRMTSSEGALRLSGSQKSATRLVSWPVGSFSPAAAPVISFDYKSSNPKPWQMLLRAKSKMHALNLGGLESHFPILMAAPPLIADGKWHTCEINLGIARSPIEQIDEVLMGSWINAEALGKVEPGFKSAKDNVLYIKNLWIGKPARDLSVVMNWVVHDPSGIRKSEWWVDEESGSRASKAESLKGEVLNHSLTPEQKCAIRFKLPKAGAWYCHVIAEDTSGNRSVAACFSLRIDVRSADSRDLMVHKLLKQTEGKIAWEQPDGRFTIKLTGYGVLLDPKKTVLIVDGVEFPAPNCVWDPTSETMTIDKKSFQSGLKGGIPLGFDGEKTKVQFVLYDIAGRKQPQQPEFEFEIKSPFTYQRTDSEMIIGLKQGVKKEEWYATWVNPISPWADYFPGAVNNTLLLCQQREGTKVGEKIYYLAQPLMWRKPVRIQPSDLRPVVWQETWNSPQSEMLDEKNAVVRQSPSHPGYNTSYWTWTLDGSESFSPQTVRVVSLTKKNKFDIRTMPLTELNGFLNRQEPGAKMRIDGWLHPEHAKSLRIRIADKRRLFYAYGDSLKWLDVKRDAQGAKDMTLVPDQDWTRFSILVEAPKKIISHSPAYFGGQSYW